MTLQSPRLLLGAKPQEATFRERLPVQPVDATPPGINLFLKSGVRNAETMEAVFGPAGQLVEPLVPVQLVDATSPGINLSLKRWCS